MKFIETNNKESIIEPRIGDAGYDIRAATDPIVDAEKKFIEYGTNVRIVPNDDDVHTLVLPRSSISNTHLFLANSVALIDNSYRGEIRLRFRYLGDLNDIDNNFIYQMGDKIGQLVFFKPEFPLVIESSNLAESVRGNGGFGSTGR